jgi:serine/threonine-protein kinase
VLGTAAYLSPEQARGEPAGPASDLYALGVVSYQLLAGRLPYEAASLTDLARQQDSVAPPPLDRVDPGIPRPLAQVVARALERDPADRFGDAAAMERALTDAMRGVAPPPPEPDDTEATRMLEGTAVTTPLSRTQAAPARRRRMEPIAEPAPPPRRQPARAAAAPHPAAQRRRPGSAWRTIRTLLVIALLVAIAVGGYVLVSETGQRGVQLKERVEGNVNDAVQEIQDLISENTQ